MPEALSWSGSVVSELWKKRRAFGLADIMEILNIKSFERMVSLTHIRPY